jgi:hypothetical protein
VRSLLVSAVVAVICSGLVSLRETSSTFACVQPDESALAAAFDLAANGLLPPSYPALPAGDEARTIPPSLLKAVGWVESGWRQFAPAGKPLVSFDFGYGVMQITSGMAGAFGDPAGDIDLNSQSRIATDYEYNIAYGASILLSKWQSTPPIGSRDPSIIEDWYYALWAYNGWGWANNPNNPRFTRTGTPAEDPAAYPYQERVLYLVSHPPRDKDGNYLWRPVPVTLPPPSAIGTNPGPIVHLSTVHRQAPPVLSAVYRPTALAPSRPGTSQGVTVLVRNTGTSAWPAAGTGATSLTYDLLVPGTSLNHPLTPFSKGVVALGQAPVPLPHDVLPGHAVTFKMVVHTPSRTGRYILAWDIENGPGILGNAEGVLPYQQTLVADATSTPSEGVPTPTPGPRTAVETLVYVADTSVPDGTAMGAARPFIKGWLVFNNGKIGWGKGWILRLAHGTAMGTRSVAVPPTAPCRTALILLALKAPSRAGTYRQVWRLHDPMGRAVGDSLTVVISVNGSGSGTPVPSVTAVPTAGPPTPVPTATPVG